MAEMAEVEPNLLELLLEIRAAFDSGDWKRTVSIYEDARNRLRPDRGLRVEAGCLAARAHIATGERSAARLILRSLGGGEYPKAVHYEFLARAFLDLKQYKDAAEACRQAEVLRQATERAVRPPERP